MLSLQEILGLGLSKEVENSTNPFYALVGLNKGIHHSDLRSKMYNTDSGILLDEIQNILWLLDPVTGKFLIIGENGKIEGWHLCSNVFEKLNYSLEISRDSTRDEYILTIQGDEGHEFFSHPFDEEFIRAFGDYGYVHRGYNRLKIFGRVPYLMRDIQHALNSFKLKEKNY